MKAATARYTALTPDAVPIAGNVSNEIARPAGHELTKIAIAVAISRPANQSVSILVISTLSSTPPLPAIMRPTICQPQASEAAIASEPTSISPNPTATAGLSPNLRPIAPPGNAIATPGVK